MRKRSRWIIKDELYKLLKGLIIVVISGSLIMLVIKSVGVEKFEFTEKVLGLSVWGFVGVLAFVIAWAVVYREDIKKIVRWIKK
jgi:multisubunit Na+/H+ antiporter MnhB subunit